MTGAHATSRPPIVLEAVETCVLCDHAESRPWARVDDFAFLRCQKCGLVRLSPRVSVQSLGHFYGAGFLAPDQTRQDINDELANPTFRFHRQTLESATTERSIFEVGCGDGNFLAYMRKHGWAVAGSEFSHENVEYVRQRHGIDAKLGDFTDLPIAPESCSAIGIYHVIEHVMQPVDLVHAMARALKPGGILHIQTPNIGSLEARLAHQFFFGLSTPLHTFLFDPTTLRRLLDQAGFTIKQIRTYDPYHSPSMTAYTIRSVSARLLKRKHPHASTPPTPGAGNGAAQASATRRGSEWLLAHGARPLSRLGGSAGVGNVLDVVAIKS
jgi:2-polyprenyl-3-methyl-5-hydroxy-6-metoxy-1,4-benzoquinol methylase